MSSPVHLGLDTASGDVTLFATRGTQSAGTQLDLGKTSAHLLREIDALLVRLDAKPRDLGSLVCSAGPGSFTGIRIGLATCLGLAEGLDLPAAAVSVHWAQAWAAHQDGSMDDGTTICSVLPSHGGRWSIQRFHVAAAPRAESSIETLVEIPKSETLVTSQTRCRRHLEEVGSEVLWVGPLARALARVAATVSSGESLVSWDRSSLLQPVYGAGPAVATVPRATARRT